MSTYTRPHSYSIFTHSVGSNIAGHSLLSKLRAVAQAGFDGIELFQDDLSAFAISNEFHLIQAQGDAIVVQQSQNVFSLTPPDSPMNLHRRYSESSTASDSSSGTSATSYTTRDSARAGKGCDHVAGLNDDLLVRNETGDLVYGSDELPMTYDAFGSCTATAYRQELAAASYIASYCDSLGLRVYSLQPLRDFEGWVKPEDQLIAMRRARSRFEVMRALGTDLLLICSNNQQAPTTVGNVERIGQDLAQLARFADQFGPVMAPYSKNIDGSVGRKAVPIRIGYEALSWGAHVDVWSRAWQAVRHADMYNVGLILDSFNTLAREYADPCTLTGITDQYENPYAEVMKSINALSTVPGDKIFFLQIGDARKLAAPLVPSPNAEEPRPARMIWSRGNRLFPCEYNEGAFLPVREFVHAAVMEAGYDGPWSIEVFNSSLLDGDKGVPVSHALRARAGLDLLVEEVYA